MNYPTTQYLLNCNKCNAKTPQIIHHLNRFKGARLRCLVCHHIKNRWVNIKLLEEKEKQNATNS